MPQAVKNALTLVQLRSVVVKSFKNRYHTLLDNFVYNSTPCIMKKPNWRKNGCYKLEPKYKNIQNAQNSQGDNNDNFR